MATCSICLEHLKKDQKIKCTPCMHPFHTECIDPWLNENANKHIIQCPTCKNDISVLVEHKNIDRPVFSHFGLGIIRNQEPLINRVNNPIRLDEDLQRPDEDLQRPDENLVRRTYQRLRSSSIKKIKYRKKSLNKACRRLGRLRY